MIRDISSVFFNGIKKTFTLKGRASKKEYIIFTIFEFLIFTPLLIIERKYGRTGLLNIAIAFAAIIHLFIYTSVNVRRLHDCGLSGWWYILNFIFSPFIFLILCLIKGDKNKNKYGSPPKE